MNNPISMLSPEAQGVVYTLLITTLVGAAGSALEALGNSRRWPWLVALGKKLEAGGNDLPKLMGKRAHDPQILKDEKVAEKRAEVPGDA